MLPLSVRQAVEDELAKRYTESVSIIDAHAFRFSQVFRCVVKSSDRTETVIVRLPREGVGERSGVVGLDRERAALEYLTAQGITLAPRFLAGGGDAGFLVTEDLGAGSSLLDLLLGKDREAAIRGVVGFARSLGALHAKTVSSTCPASIPIPVFSLTEDWQHVCEAVAHMGLPEPKGTEQDVAEVVRVLAESENYVALSSGDPSVVNCKILNVATGKVRFFDFEEACFRHAFLDAFVLRFLYPTGAPAWRLPEITSQQIEAAHRTELARACPAIEDDAHYEANMAAACAAWVIRRLARLTRVDIGPDRDEWLLLPHDWSGPIPTRSRRSQLLSILETGIDAVRRAHTLGSLADWFECVTDALRSRWPEAIEELSLYPAFTTRIL